jgi:hypothetical protein
MDKAILRVLFPLLILATILAFTLALSPSSSGYAHPSARSTPSAGAHVQPPRHNSVGAAAPTPTPTGARPSQPGSTDGIVIMGFAIVVIIILPILIQRSLWKP